jgi:hypothetical protein
MPNSPVFFTGTFRNQAVFFSGDDLFVVYKMHYKQSAPEER